MRFRGTKILMSAASLLFAVTTMAADSVIDPSLPNYQRVNGLSGKLVLVGSDTMSQVAARWADGFQQYYPNVQIEIQVQGSRNAVASVQTGQASFGLLSRQINEQEVRDFHAARGYVPTVLTPALEPLAIFVHKDNPIQSLTLAQIDAAFSTSLKRGEKKTARTWGDLGAQGQWAQVPVIPQVRSSDTGSQVFFQAAILGNGQFRPDAQAHGDNLDLVKAVATNHGGIGFAGSGNATPDVKMVPLSWQTGMPAVDAQTPGYPLVRPLQIVVNNPPNGDLPPLQSEFLKFIFSSRGQQDVVLTGFLPVPSKVAQKSLNAVGEAILN
ncbi:MAG: substrate-binding domain-containing protein [Planctomycetaceae bacterium]|nr:substrate-binding domain-containing protein [Planctomycetaceae bacterium]